MLPGTGKRKAAPSGCPAESRTKNSSSSSDQASPVARQTRQSVARIREAEFDNKDADHSDGRECVGDEDGDDVAHGNNGDGHGTHSNNEGPSRKRRTLGKSATRHSLSRTKRSIKDVEPENPKICSENLKKIKEAENGTAKTIAMSRQMSSKHVQCLFCPKVLWKSSMIRHLRRFHPKESVGGQDSGSTNQKAVGSGTPAATKNDEQCIETKKRASSDEALVTDCEEDPRMRLHASNKNENKDARNRENLDGTQACVADDLIEKLVSSKCDICSKVLKKDSMKRHMKIIHKIDDGNLASSIARKVAASSQGVELEESKFEEGIASEKRNDDHQLEKMELGEEKRSQMEFGGSYVEMSIAAQGATGKMADQDDGDESGTGTMAKQDGGDESGTGTMAKQDGGDESCTKATVEQASIDEDHTNALAEKRSTAVTHQVASETKYKFSVRCETCGRAIEKSKINRHQVTHHGADLSILGLDPASFDKKCDVCGMYFPDMLLLKHHKRQQGHFAKLSLDKLQTGNRNLTITGNVPQLKCTPDGGVVDNNGKNHAGLNGELENGLLKKLPMPDVEEQVAAILEQVPNPTYAAYQEAYQEFREGKRVKPRRERKTRSRCKKCSKDFKSLGEARDHVRNKHLDVKLYECLVCGKKGYVRGAMTYHVQKHTGEKPHECRVCGEMFATPPLVQNHIERYHGQKAKSVRKKPMPTICEICGATCSSRWSLETHKKSVHTMELFECDICGQKLKTERLLKNHKRSIHDRIITNVCEICGRGFRHPATYQKHMDYHRNRLPYKCDICGRGFVSPSILKIHKDRHSGNKPFECKICGKRFVTSSSLYPHMAVHSAERPFKCTDCPKTFKRKKHLDSHRLVHSKMKYPCGVCGKLFNMPGTRSTHMKRHSGVKPHSCSFCGKAFFTKGDCRRHENTHRKTSAPYTQRHEPSHKEMSELQEVVENSPVCEENSGTGNVMETEAVEMMVVETDQAIGEVLYLMSIHGDENNLTIS